MASKALGFHFVISLLDDIQLLNIINVKGQVRHLH